MLARRAMTGSEYATPTRNSPRNDVEKTCDTTTEKRYVDINESVHEDDVALLKNRNRIAQPWPIVSVFNLSRQEIFAARLTFFLNPTRKRGAVSYPTRERGTDWKYDASSLTRRVSIAGL